MRRTQANRNRGFGIRAKLGALGLTLAALTGSTVAAPPQQALNGNAVGPVHAFSWHRASASLTNITPMVWIKSWLPASQIAAEVNALPPGKRYLFLWDIDDNLLRHPSDVCRTPQGQPTTYQGVWPTNGTALMKQRMQNFFQAFVAAGGQADALIIDFEDNYSNWVIGGFEATAHWQAIQNDPRFPALAAELGFSNLALVQDHQHNPHYLKWNSVMASVVDRALNEAAFEVARQYFPNIKASNWDSVYLPQENASVELNGHPLWREGQPMGTHNTYAFYGWINLLGERELTPGQPYGYSPLAGLRLSVNQMRAIRRSSNLPMYAWVHSFYHEGDGPGQPRSVTGRSTYYRELMIHLAMHGITDYIFFNPHPFEPGQDPAVFAQHSDELKMHNLITEINSKFEGSTRSPLTLENIPWNSPVVASGIRIGSNQLWRVTLNSNIRSIRVWVDGLPRILQATPTNPGVWLTIPGSATLTLTPEQSGPAFTVTANFDPNDNALRSSYAIVTPRPRNSAQAPQERESRNAGSGGSRIATGGGRRTND